MTGATREPVAIDTPAAVAPLTRGTWRDAVRTDRRRGPAIVLSLLLLTLALLPFEGVWLTSVVTPAWRWVMTDVEAFALVTFGAWVLLLAAERRLPRVPRGPALALAALAVVTWLSAFAAGANQGLGLVIAARASLAWGLFLVVVDLVRDRRAAMLLVGVLVAAGVVSALTGWVAAAHGSMAGLFGAGRLFTVGGVARMAGTWDYPTIAAMAWEAIVLLALPLLAWRSRRLGGRRWPVLAIGVPFVVLLGSAILMTLTRGAFFGLAAGLAVVLLGAWLLRSRPLALVTGAAVGALAIGAAALYLTLPLPIDRLLHESDADLYGADYTVTGRLAAAPGSRLAVDLTVRNTGLATWRPDGPRPWVLAAVWIAPDSRATLTAHQVAARLPGPVPPGASVELQAIVDVPGMPGELDLAWDMQQLDVADFSERDVPVAITHVTADADAAGRPQPVVPAERLLLYPTKLPILDRTELWTAAVRLVEKHPLLGVGPGAYRRVYGAELGLTRWDTQIHANDVYLELAATTGLLGLGAFLATVLLSFVRGVRGIATVGRDGSGLAALLVIGALAATAAALGHGIVDHFLVFVPMAILFWVPLGMAVGLTATLAVRRGATAPGAA